jgi:hypothetical protein
MYEIYVRQAGWRLAWPTVRRAVLPTSLKSARNSTSHKKIVDLSRGETGETGTGKNFWIWSFFREEKQGQAKIFGFGHFLGKNNFDNKSSMVKNKTLVAKEVKYPIQYC